MIKSKHKNFYRVDFRGLRTKVLFYRVVNPLAKANGQELKPGEGFSPELKRIILAEKGKTL
jgi:hypothetical protein